MQQGKVKPLQQEKSVLKLKDRTTERKKKEETEGGKSIRMAVHKDII